MTPTDKTSPDKSTDPSFLNQKVDDKKPDAPKPDDKAPEVKADDKKPDDKKPNAPTGPPEKYEDFKVPDGYKFDEAALKSANELFKDLGLTQEQAQKAVDFYAKNGLQAAEAPYKAWADTQKEWLADINDRFGSKADAVRTDINKAIGNALPPSLARAFKSALDITGAGSNPDIVEALHIMTKSLVEGTPVRGNNPAPVKAPDAPAKPSAAEAMYPHLIQNRPQ